MKKKFLTLLLTIAAVVSCAFAFSACEGGNPSESSSVPSNIGGGNDSSNHGGNGGSSNSGNSGWGDSSSSSSSDNSGVSNSSGDGGSSSVGGNLDVLTPEMEDDLSNFYYTFTPGSCVITGIVDNTVTEIVIPDFVTGIGNRAFAFCSSLTSVVIGDGVTSIGYFAFYNCSSLTSITVSENNAAYKSIDGNLYTKDGKTLLQYAIGKTDTSFTVPDSVTSIGNSAFFECNSLTSVVIPDSVTLIDNNAFSDCSSLTNVYITDIAAWCNISFGYNAANPLFYANNLYLNNEPVTELTIPDSVTSIGRYAFYGFSSLTGVVIGDSVTSIGENAFYGCSSLTSITINENNTEYKSIGGNLYTKDGKTLLQYAIGKAATSFTIPDGVTSIGDGAFFKCSSLTSVEIPDSVTSIGNYAFENCSSLTSVVIGDSVTSIGYFAFYNCSSLTGVYITDIAAWCNISFDTSTPTANPLFYAGNLYLNNEPVTELIIPDGVTSIGYAAFYNCSSLTSVVIPDDVTSIGKCAFYKCSSLTSVVIPDSVTSIGYKAFYDCGSLTIYCEADSKPSGWESDWNYSYCPVVWGYKE